MVAERHGIYISEASTVFPSTSLDPTLPVVFGTAPINLTTRSNVPVNEPILISSYQEAVDIFGYSDNWDAFTLCEFIYSHLKLFKQAPIVLVNVLDPAIHKTTIAPVDKTVNGGVAIVAVEGVLKAGVIVKSSDDATTYVLNTDYTLAYNKDGHLVVTRKTTGAIPSNVATLKIGYNVLDGTTVGTDELIGGVDALSGVATGLELLNQVFPRFQLVPSLLLAPGFSSDPIVAAVMAAKAESISGHFRCMALVDLPLDEITSYTDAPVWKADNAYTYSNQYVGFGKPTKGGKVFHLSTQLAGAICETDAANNNVPSASPSNKALQADGAIQSNGQTLFLSSDQAAYLNAQGIVTALNFVGGWKVWGNRLGAYPNNKDPKDSFIPVRRMFDWLGNQIILRYWQRIDNPLNKRLVETVTDSINIWLNGLQTAGAVVGARVEFLASENNAEDLMNGKMKFHLFVTPPSPAQEINFVLEYDASYLSSIMG